MVLQGPYVRQTLPLDQQDSVRGEIIAISDISFGTQEKTVPPRTARSRVAGLWRAGLTPPIAWRTPPGFAFCAATVGDIIYFLSLLDIVWENVSWGGPVREV